MKSSLGKWVLIWFRQFINSFPFDWKQMVFHFRRLQHSKWKVLRVELFSLHIFLFTDFLPLFIRCFFLLLEFFISIRKVFAKKNSFTSRGGIKFWTPAVKSPKNEKRWKIPAGNRNLCRFFITTTKDDYCFLSCQERVDWGLWPYLTFLLFDCCETI